MTQSSNRHRAIVILLLLAAAVVVDGCFGSGAPLVKRPAGDLLPNDTPANEPPTPPVPPGPPWTSELAQARADARRDGVDLLLWFHEVRDGGAKSALQPVFNDPLAQAEFAKAFRLTELRYDPDAPLDEHDDFTGIATVGAHSSWGATPGGREENYRSGLWATFPPFLLADCNGRPYAIAPSYRDKDSEGWLQLVLKLTSVRKQRDLAFDDAARLNGIDRAKALARAIEIMDDHLVRAFDDPLVAIFYRAELREIVELDRDGTAGLEPNYRRMLQWGEGMPVIRLMEGNVMAALLPKHGDSWKGAIAKLMGDHVDNPVVQQFGRACAAMATCKDDPLGAGKGLLEARAMDPHSRVCRTIDKWLRQLAEGAERQNTNAGK
jgi:hypothetical protein